jgi:hypothetical protein
MLLSLVCRHGGSTNIDRQNSCAGEVRRIVSALLAALCRLVERAVRPASTGNLASCGCLWLALRVALAWLTPSIQFFFAPACSSSARFKRSTPRHSLVLSTYSTPLHTCMGQWPPL